MLLLRLTEAKRDLSKHSHLSVETFETMILDMIEILQQLSISLLEKVKLSLRQVPSRVSYSDI